MTKKWSGIGCIAWPSIFEKTCFKTCIIPFISP